MEPRLTVLGVYNPHIPEEVYREQWQVTASDDQTQQHFAGLVLDRSGCRRDAGDRFKAIELGQPYQEHFQCAYDEATAFSADGELLIDRRMNCVVGTGPLRFAFYLHFYNPERPLEWSCGRVQSSGRRTDFGPSQTTCPVLTRLYVAKPRRNERQENPVADAKAVYESGTRDRADVMNDS